MAVTIKHTPTLVRPAGSHYLNLGHRAAFDKEELYPILEVQAPRVGLVRATFSVDRYEYSGGTWSDWRIYLREVRTPDADRPDLPHLGRVAGGIGDATHRAISDACVPIIHEWLESDGYRASRQRAAASAIARSVDTPADYTIARGRETLAALQGELTEEAANAIGNALHALEEARAAIDKATAAE